MASDSLGRELPCAKSCMHQEQDKPCTEQSAAKKRRQGLGEVSNAARKVMELLAMSERQGKGKGREQRSE